MFNNPPHRQEITFDNKTKLTLYNVETIEVGNMTHILVRGGKEYIINQDRVLFIKIYKKNKTDYE